MGVKRLLYVTDLKDVNVSFHVLENVSAIQREGCTTISLLTSDSAEWRSMVSKSGMDVSTRVLPAVSVSAILSVAETEAVSMVVLCVRNSLREKIVAGLMERASVPILVHGYGGADKGILQHVIIGMDWEAPSEKALKFTLDLRDMIGELDMIHVIDEKLTVKGMRELRERLAVTRKVCLDKGVDAEFHIYAGKTGDEIVTAAKDYRGTSIILGIEPRKSFIGRWFHKGTAHVVAEKSEIPLFLIPSGIKSA